MGFITEYTMSTLYQNIKMQKIIPDPCSQNQIQDYDKIIYTSNLIEFFFSGFGANNFCDSPHLACSGGYPRHIARPLLGSQRAHFILPDKASIARIASFLAGGWLQKMCRSHMPFPASFSYGALFHFGRNLNLNLNLKRMITFQNM